MAMTMTGEATLPADRPEVWTLLNDPAVLKACIPGCQSLERTGENGFAAVVKTKIGPVAATFKGKVELPTSSPRSATPSLARARAASPASPRAGRKCRSPTPRAARSCDTTSRRMSAARWLSSGPADRRRRQGHGRQILRLFRGSGRGARRLASPPSPRRRAGPSQAWPPRRCRGGPAASASFAANERSRGSGGYGNG